METIRVALFDAEAVIRAGLVAALAAEPDFALIDDATGPHDATGSTGYPMADVAIVKVPNRSPDRLDAIHGLLKRDPQTRVIAIAEQALPETLFHLLGTGIHGLLLARTAERNIVDAIRAVHGGGTYICSDAARLMIPHYLDRRGALSVNDRWSLLSAREREVLALVLEGNPNSEIAQRLSISPKSVCAYRSRLMKKLGVTDVPSLVKSTLRHQPTPGDSLECASK